MDALKLSYLSQFENYIDVSAAGQPILLSFLLKLRPHTRHPALLFYDYFLTFPLELSTIWTSKFNGASLAYLIGRYGNALYWILSLIVYLAPITSVSVRLLNFLSIHLYSPIVFIVVCIFHQLGHSITLILGLRCSGLSNFLWVTSIVRDAGQMGK